MREQKSQKYHNDKSQAERCYDFAVSLVDVWRYDEAIDELKKSINLEPHNAKYRYKTGVILDKMGLPKKAISQLKKAVKLEPNNSLYHHTLGKLLQETGNHKAALAQKKIVEELKL